MAFTRWFFKVLSKRISKRKNNIYIERLIMAKIRLSAVLMDGLSTVANSQALSNYCLTREILPAVCPPSAGPSLLRQSVSFWQPTVLPSSNRRQIPAYKYPDHRITPLLPAEKHRYNLSKSTSRIFQIFVCNLFFVLT